MVTQKDNPKHNGNSQNISSFIGKRTDKKSKDGVKGGGGMEGRKIYPSYSILTLGILGPWR